MKTASELVGSTVAMEHHIEALETLADGRQVSDWPHTYVAPVQISHTRMQIYQMWRIDRMVTGSLGLK